MTWRLAKSLDTLRSQVNALVPHRDKSSDGTIGDPRHAATRSEHNPDANGVVRAMDISHDPKDGVDTYAMAESLRVTRDPRVLYVISNGRIFSSQVSPWAWRAYHGSNRHDHHVHISVVANKSLYDSTQPWVFNLGGSHPQSDSNQPTLPPRTKPDRPMLKRGSEGEDVAFLQRLLKIKDDGDFWQSTENAVRDFQQHSGLVPDGIVGPYTWHVLLQ